MKYPTLRFVFDRKHVATSEKKGLVQIEVTFSGKRKWIGTGVKLYKHQWDDQKKVIRNLDSVRLNALLDEQVAKINEYVMQLVKKGAPFSFDDFEEILKKPSAVSFLDFIQDRIDNRNDISESTIKQHRTLLMSLFDFGKICSVEDLTRQNIMLFDDFLHKKGITQTTVFNYHKRLKRYINEAILFGLIDKNPYSSMKMDRGKSKKRKYLTAEELERVKSCPINSVAVERVRDLFLFQAYTGLSYSDLQKFDFQNNVEIRGDKYMIADRRLKTNEDYFIILLSPALEVLRKYDFKLPVISNTKYNLMLKVVSEFAGIGKPLTTHMARHTFAVFALNNGIPIEVVSKMLGHSNINTTQIYAKIVQNSVVEAFNKLEDVIKK